MEALKAELMGPSPSGDIINLTESPFEDKPVRYKWDELSEPEEILRRENPTQRYGVGVIYPLSIQANDLEDISSPIVELSDSEQANEETESKAFEELSSKIYATNSSNDEEEEGLKLDGANKFQPSSLGISFLVETINTASIEVTFEGGKYEHRTMSVIQKEKKFIENDPIFNADINVENVGTLTAAALVEERDSGTLEEVKDPIPNVKEHDWYFRKPVSLRVVFNGDDIASKTSGFVTGVIASSLNLEHTQLEIRCYITPSHRLEKGTKLLTVVAINNSQCKKSETYSYCVFQSQFSATISAKSNNGNLILPYPSMGSLASDEEEEQIALLYREFETYAVGHGCAADWSAVTDRGVVSVSATPLPTYEAPSTTHEITYLDSSGSLVTVPETEINLLADPTKKQDAIKMLEGLIDHYEQWCKSEILAVSGLKKEHQQTAVGNLKACKNAADRMRDGILFLENEQAYRAFQMANHAMLLQRDRSKLRVRSRTGKTFGVYPKVPTFESIPRATWRPFQIAFILLSLRSAVEPDNIHRETVELIWFPTGGGKTEAYLGLSAFVAFHRRLVDSEDIGTTVLMRYTLRLLTQQQLLRAASLICAMEYLRSRVYSDLIGIHRFTIGLWVGGDVTPSTIAKAKEIFNSIRKGNKVEDNILVLTRCPWCGAEMSVSPGVTDGVEEEGQTIKYCCPDGACDFNSDNDDFLPVEFIDQEIYLSPPTIIIGTIDKFATMHLDRSTEARSIFGFGSAQGEGMAPRKYSPPSLVIQDELHLISGPLGSTAGLYEALIEELCTDRRGQPIKPTIKPKIVCSTATIRGYKDQVLGLYARKLALLFPPSGISAGDSFFAQYAKDSQGNLLPGRQYVGIHPTGFTSGQTSRVRTFSALLQAPCDLILNTPICCDEAVCPYTEKPPTCNTQLTKLQCRNAQDPWWTLMIYFNSLRDLGNAISLFQTDLPDYRRVISRRRAVDRSALRHAYQPLELTGRLNNSEIPSRLAALEIPRNSTDNASIDVCLASNIIEVGIDVERLGIMCVVAQPKSTSTYIQVTGRVGRNWREKPGLVVTIYAADRPRDRSHFERFRSYHERMYSQVEPTSVTPFSRPLLERALHGVVAAYVRLLGSQQESENPTPFPSDHYNRFIGILLRRARFCNMAEHHIDINEVASLRMEQWKQYGPTKWNAKANEPESLLKAPSGNPLEELSFRLPLPTPMSMRNVDASCELQSTDKFVKIIARKEAFSEDYE